VVDLARLSGNLQVRACAVEVPARHGTLKPLHGGTVGAASARLLSAILVSVTIAFLQVPQDGSFSIAAGIGWPAVILSDLLQLCCQRLEDRASHDSAFWRWTSLHPVGDSVTDVMTTVGETWARLILSFSLWN
jgi:hypothetical protein